MLSPTLGQKSFSACSLTVAFPSWNASALYAAYVCTNRTFTIISATRGFSFVPLDLLLLTYENQIYCIDVD